jgi:hypothetical protein
LLAATQTCPPKNSLKNPGFCRASLRKVGIFNQFGYSKVQSFGNFINFLLPILAARFFLDSNKINLWTKADLVRVLYHFPSKIQNLAKYF